MLLPALESFELKALVVAQSGLVVQVAVSDLVPSERAESVEDAANRAMSDNMFRGFVGYSKHLLLENNCAPVLEQS